MSIPLTDVRAQYEALSPVVRRALEQVVDSGHFVLGPSVKAFEQEAAAATGTAEAVGVANGTDALVLTLDALGVGSGDEVICPALTFYATAEAIARLGATPVFCDVQAATLNLDPGHVAGLVTPRTKAIVAVHLFGRPAPIGDLPDGIPVVEDAAQAFGATLGDRPVGSLGVAGTFSFFPTKNLFCFGDGGLVVTSDPALADRIRMLRFHGSSDKQTFEFVGYNSRLDELQASILRVFLPELDRWNGLRREAAARYAELGLGELCELPEDDPGHVYHLYVVRSDARERLIDALGAAGIAARPYYATPLHLQPVFRGLGYEAGSLPVTEQVAADNLALPMWAGISDAEQRAVVGAARTAFAGAST